MRLIMLSMLVIGLVAPSVFGQLGESDIEIRDIIIAPEALSCSKSIPITVQFKNVGDTDEYVTVEIINARLPANEISTITLVQRERIETATVTIDLEKEPKGLFEFEALVSYDTHIKRLFRSFTFEGCPEEPVMMDAQVQTEQQDNDGLVDEEPRVQISRHLVLTLSFALIIMLLSIVYVLKRVIERD
jgi:hypothetical protein